MPSPLTEARVTPAQAARLLGISRQLINDWRIRNRISPGQDGRYRFGDIADVEHDTRTNDQPGAWQRGGTRNLVSA